MDNSPFQKFSESARAVLLTAQERATAAGNPTSSAYILLAITAHHDSLAHNILMSYDVTAQKLEHLLQQTETATVMLKKPILGTDVAKILDRAVTLAAQYDHVGVDTEHLLLAIVSHDQSAAYGLLKQLGANPERIKEQLITLFTELQQLDEFDGSSPDALPQRGNEGPADMPRNNRRPGSSLAYFTTDLTKLAQEKKLDPVIGREEELNRMIKILSRRTKNNPILIGETGVGKTAIVEGLAQQIVNEKVPTTLLNKRVLTLDLGLLVAGTMYRGQFEERIKKVLDELQKLHNVIVFIDEFHTIIGAGSAEGSLDAAQILKPALAKGYLHMIGATTFQEYQKYIEKDAALTRRFQPIVVKEPSIENTIAILTGLRPQYEEHHRVSISDEALQSAAILAHRYISDRFLPDKAIDLIDETAAAARVKQHHDKQYILLSRELDQIAHKKETAVHKEQYEAASKLQKREVSIRQSLDKLEQKIAKLKPVVITSFDIEQTVASITGIPPLTLKTDDVTNVMNIEKTLHQHIIGQDEAINAVARAIRRSRTGIGQPNRPIGSFIFLGPSGVGKSELAKTIAKELYGSETSLVKIDMSEFMERHNVSRLVGAPAGYIGYEEGGKLTETIRHQPYSVLLLDEIEKADPEVFNLLLQILEDGYLTDAKGRKVDFRNTIIIMTSNIGMEELTHQAGIGFNARDAAAEEQAVAQFESLKDTLLKNLEDQFRPEFLNRIDHTIVFQPLTKEHLRKIVDIQLQELIERAAQKGIKIQIDSAARSFLAEQGYDARLGARPLRRAIQQHVEDKIAEAILNGSVDKKKTASIRRRNDELVLG